VSTTSGVPFAPHPSGARHRLPERVDEPPGDLAHAMSDVKAAVFLGCGLREWLRDAPYEHRRARDRCESPRPHNRQYGSLEERS